MAISVSQLRAEFTSQLVAVYQERIRPTSFLRSFFPTVTAPTKYVSIEVERMGEKIAVDVVRGTEGNRNSFSRSSAKTFLPPIWREYFDATELDLYDRVLGAQGSAQAPLFTSLLNSVADRLGTLQDKIERSKEIQCAQVLQTGIVTMTHGENIDFKRKAGSIVDAGAGQYFANNIDPFKMFEAGATFLRQVGRSGDGTFNAIVGSTALSDLLNNTKFQARQNTMNMVLDSVIMPVRNALGMTFHGTITAGAYKVQLWSYPQFYDDATTGTSTAYIDPKLVVMLPAMPNFVFAHAAVPQLMGEPGQMPVQGEYVFGDFVDQRLASHVFDVQSAAVPIPVAVDQIYTFRGVAA